jgi:hypothetical protein
VNRLAYALAGAGDITTSAALLRQLQPLHRDDFWINVYLADGSIPKKWRLPSGPDRMACALLAPQHS